jgi:tetratricopeptide (TPR) repeat protein
LDTICESNDALKSIREEGQKITKSPFKEKLRFLDNDIIAKNFMIGKLDANGNRMIFPSVVSYFLEENYNGDGYTYPCQAARILEWLNREDEAINILSEAINQTPDSWVAANNLGQMLSRRERHAEAVQWADYIIKIRPWEIESYDISIYIYTRAGDKAKAALLEEESNRVFAEAERLRTKFTELATQTINIR